MFVFRLIFIFLLFYCFSLSKEIITVKEDTLKLNILPGSKIYIDKTKKLTFKDLKKISFEDIDKKSLSFGYSPDFNVWIKFTLENKSNKKLEKILEYANPITTHIEFYNGEKLFKEGLYQLDLKRKSLNPVFDISLSPKETKTFYIKASSHITTLKIKLYLWDKIFLDDEIQRHNMILGMFFASMVILMLYNFFIYFYTKDKNYLFYVFFMTGIVFHQLVYTGFGNIYLLNKAQTIFCIKYAEVFTALPVFMFALLVSSFLKVRKYPFFHRVLNIYLVIFPFFVAAVLLVQSSGFRNIYSVILLLFLLFISIYAAFKKNRQAYFVLPGWILFVLSGVFMYLSSAGVVDIFDDLRYFVESSLILEAVIFSIALADKIKQLQFKKNKANLELILQQHFEKQRLEKQVRQKTKELNIALEEKNLLLKELNHRVKNNMQMIVSLIRLQSDKYKDKDTEELLRTIQNRINAMGALL